MVEFTSLPYETLQERFNTGSRYDALGSWPASLCATDPETNISKEISDEEVKASCAEIRGNIDDPDGRWLIKKLRTNQIFFCAYSRRKPTGLQSPSLQPSNIHRSRPRTEGDALQLSWTFERAHSKGHWIHNVFSYSPSPESPTAYLCIDPVGVVLIMSLRETSADTLAFLVDHDVQVPAKFVDKITERKIDAETNPQHHTKRVALKHLEHSDYMGEGQQSIMDTTITPEERARVARPGHPKSAPSARARRDDWNPAPRNINYWLGKGRGKGKYKGKSAEEQAWERERYRRWEREVVE